VVIVRSGNRYPEALDDPDNFIIDRRARQHLSVSARDPRWSSAPVSRIALRIL